MDLVERRDLQSKEFKKMPRPEKLRKKKGTPICPKWMDRGYRQQTGGWLAAYGGKLTEQWNGAARK